MTYVPLSAVFVSCAQYAPAPPELPALPFAPPPHIHTSVSRYVPSTVSVPDPVMVYSVYSTPPDVMVFVVCVPE